MNLLNTMTGAWAVSEETVAYLKAWNPEVKGVTSPMVAEAQTSRRKGVAVIGVYGVLEMRQSLLGFLMGGTSTRDIGVAFDAAVNDSSVAAIMLDVDSPGGSVFGIQELSAKIRDARGQKPIVSVANAAAASGAYWVASAADRLYVTPSGVVGSVGVFHMHVDRSEAEDGEKVEIIRSTGSPYKAEASGVEPLTDEGRDHLQKMADETYDTFVGDLAKNRGVPVGDVRENYGKGRVMTAQNALSAGMVDRVGTSEDVLGRLFDGRIRISRGKVYDDNGGVRVDSAKARIEIERRLAHVDRGVILSDT